MDALRFDVFEDFFPDSNYRYTAGSHSKEFIEKNFSDGEFKDVVVVTANPHYTKEIFEYLTGRAPENVFYEVYNEFIDSWDSEGGTVMPEDMVETIELVDKLYLEKRILAHFMQPRYPLIQSDFEEDKISMEEDFESVWRRADKGKIPSEKLWRAYIKNFDLVFSKLEHMA